MGDSKPCLSPAWLQEGLLSQDLGVPRALVPCSTAGLVRHSPATGEICHQPADKSPWRQGKWLSQLNFLL